MATGKPQFGTQQTMSDNDKKRNSANRSYHDTTQINDLFFSLSFALLPHACGGTWGGWRGPGWGFHQPYGAAAINHAFPTIRRSRHQPCVTNPNRRSLFTVNSQLLFTVNCQPSTALHRQLSAVNCQPSTACIHPTIHPSHPFFL